jgi:hypothetical protein
VTEIQTTQARPEKAGIWNAILLTITVTGMSAAQHLLF